jgi:hypothetical protein
VQISEKVEVNGTEQSSLIPKGSDYGRKKFNNTALLVIPVSNVIQLLQLYFTSVENKIECLLQEPTLKGTSLGLGSQTLA